jgi:hypothetical protein
MTGLELLKDIRFRMNEKCDEMGLVNFATWNPSDTFDQEGYSDEFQRKLESAKRRDELCGLAVVHRFVKSRYNDLSTEIPDLDLDAVFAEYVFAQYLSTFNL